MGARPTRSAEYSSLMWNTLKERYPKSLSRFNEFYGALYTVAGWDWIRGRPFESLPAILRLAVISQFCIDYKLGEAKLAVPAEFLENIIESGLFRSFEELETNLINQPV